MLQSRHHTGLYLFYLAPNKNLPAIDRVKRYSAAMNTYLLNRGFRTRVEPTSSTGMGQSSASAQSDDGAKRFTILNLFNRSNSQEGLKKLLNKTKLSEDERQQIKIAFAEGYLAASESAPKKWFIQKLLERLLLVGCVLSLYFYLRDGVIKVLLGSKQHEIAAEEISVTFNDVIGVAEAKGELKDIVEFLRDPEKFSRLGARLPAGVLLVGPPGTGKTLLARAVAGEAGVPFFHASGSEFDEMLVGQGAKRIRDLFAAAKAKAPCVVFIDEIDSVGGKRTSSLLHPYANQTVNQLLSEMDGFRPNEGVIVLGATNRRDHLDNALLRPGRFDVEVTVRMPSMLDRKELFNYYLKKIKLGENIDIDGLAKTTVNFSGAEIENLCNQAALKAAINDEDGVQTKHLEFAKDKIRMGPEMKQKIPDSEVNRLTAYHEAGHTLVAWFTKEATKVHKVTILARGQTLGHTAYQPDKDQYNYTKAQMLANLDVAMGGRVAEELIFGEDKVTTGAHSDLKQATSVARNMVRNFGMSHQVGLAVHEDTRDEPIANGTLENIDNEVKLLLQESYERAKKLLKAKDKELHLLSQALLEHETLNAEQIGKVLNGEKLPTQSN